MSFMATFNPTMPQGRSSSGAFSRRAPSASSGHEIVLSKGLIAQWIADAVQRNNHMPPSEGLQNFLSSPGVDLTLDASIAPPPEPRRRARRTVNTNDADTKIPRPPNAFMIFRSDLIKNPQFALQKVEKKQQSLSVLAGEIWSFMPEEGKSCWRDKATARVREHQVKHPQYKYTPKQRNGRGKKGSKEPSPSFADAAVREQWRMESLSPLFHGPAPPPPRPRRRGPQPYEVPAPPSQQPQAGPSGASTESPWHNLALPTRPASTPADAYRCLRGTAVPTEDHMMNVYSRPPTALPPSAHSSPGSSQSEPAYFPSAHDLPSGLNTMQLPIQPPMASLYGPLASSSALEPTVPANNLPPLSMEPPTEMFLGDFSLFPVPEDPTDMRGNFPYAYDNFLNNVQYPTNGKPAGDASDQAATESIPWPLLDMPADMENLLTQYPLIPLPPASSFHLANPLPDAERDGALGAGMELPLFS